MCAEVVRLMRLHPSLGRKGQLGGWDDAGDVAAAGAWAICCMVNSHAPNKQLFLEAGAEEVLRGILTQEETSNYAKSWARARCFGGSVGAAGVEEGQQPHTSPTQQVSDTHPHHHPITPTPSPHFPHPPTPPPPPHPTVSPI